MELYLHRFRIEPPPALAACAWPKSLPAPPECKSSSSPAQIIPTKGRPPRRPRPYRSNRKCMRVFNQPPRFERHSKACHRFILPDISTGMVKPKSRELRGRLGSTTSAFAGLFTTGAWLATLGSMDVKMPERRRKLPRTAAATRSRRPRARRYRPEKFGTGSVPVLATLENKDRSGEPITLPRRHQIGRRAGWSASHSGLTIAAHCGPSSFHTTLPRPALAPWCGIHGAASAIPQQRFAKIATHRKRTASGNRDSRCDSLRRPARTSALVDEATSSALKEPPLRRSARFALGHHGGGHRGP